MKWFGRKAASGSARPALTRPLSGFATPVGQMPLGYEGQVRDAYLSNAVAQRACRLVAEAVGAAPVATSDPALARLVATTSGGQVLTETIAAHLMLHGNGYIQVLTDLDGAVRELFALRPERVSVEADARGWPVAYRYRAGGQAVILPALDAAPGGDARPAVIHVKAMHPLDDHYGAGCLSAAAGAVAAHNAATRWNRALLDNAARPSGALVHDAGPGGMPLSDEAFARLRDEMEAAFQGAAHAGRPMLLDGGLKWQAMSLSPTDMDFLSLKESAAREIALAFGVPPMLLGLPGDATYANYREASKALWRHTVIPLANRVLGAVAQGLSGWFADARLSVDLDRVPALADDREALWAQLGAADFLSDDEKRGVLGLPPRAPDPAPTPEGEAA